MKNYSRLDFYSDALTGLTVIGIGVLAFALAIVLTFFELAHGAQVMRAQPAPNGGLVSAKLTPDGKSVIQQWGDGTVTTNAVKLANTPPVDRPKIESELRKAVIVSAALAEVVADVPADAKLQLAAERATESLRSRSAGDDVVVGGETIIDIVEEPGIGGGKDVGDATIKGRE